LPPPSPDLDETFRSGRRLSLHPARYRAPSSGFFKERPSIDITTGVLSWHPCASRSRTAHPRRSMTSLPSLGVHGAFGHPLPRGRLVPTSWFHTTLPVCSTGGSQACCILLPTLGFTAFPPVARWRIGAACFPAGAQALQSFPHPHSRDDVTVIRCPPDVAGCLPLCGTRRLQGLAPWKCPLCAPVVADRAHPWLSWASPSWNLTSAVPSAPSTFRPAIRWPAVGPRAGVGTPLTKGMLQPVGFSARAGCSGTSHLPVPVAVCREPCGLRSVPRTSGGWASSPRTGRVGTSPPDRLRGARWGTAHRPDGRMPPFRCRRRVIVHTCHAVRRASGGLPEGSLQRVAGPVRSGPPRGPAHRRGCLPATTVVTRGFAVRVTSRLTRQVGPGARRCAWSCATGHLDPDSRRRNVTAASTSRSPPPGFLRRHRRGRLRHPASTYRPPAGPSAAGHRSADWMSSPTSTRLRTCRSGRPPRRPARSLAASGWFCHTRCCALVELPSLHQGPAAEARTSRRPTDCGASSHGPHLDQPAEAGGGSLTGRPVPPARAGVRASTTHRTVARQVRTSRRRPPVITCRHRCRGVPPGREPPCPGVDVLTTPPRGGWSLGRNHRHASCCRRPAGRPAPRVGGTTPGRRLAFDQGLRAVSRWLSPAHGAGTAPVAQDRRRCRRRWARAGPQSSGGGW
jgi:hypothetical protein